MACLLLLLTPPALAAPLPQCAVPGGASAVAFDAVPGAALAALKRRTGPIVPPGGAFDATDVVVTGRNRRVAFVWTAGQRWVVATERGGRGYNNPLYAFDLSPDGRSAALVGEEVAVTATLCARAAGLLGPARP